ncbi:MAG: 1,4-alpha-glucan branching enzyme, partial [Acidimicrobiia bacterium]|nr:1,4-alpha-glucan branching enzyme [Acidimicrobiia bacterium]
MSALDPELASLLAGTHTDPHRVLGVHEQPDGRWLVRFRHPGAGRASLVVGETIRQMRKVHPAGLFEVLVDEQPPLDHRFDLQLLDGNHLIAGDPYVFPPTVGELDKHLFGEGRHERLWESLGGRATVHEGVPGVAFALWAPNARAVRVVGDWNGWDGRVHPMRALGAPGIWELFVPLIGPGQRYKYELVDASGRLVMRADPMAQAAECPPATASIVAAHEHKWG